MYCRNGCRNSPEHILENVRLLFFLSTSMWMEGYTRFTYRWFYVSFWWECICCSNIELTEIGDGGKEQWNIFFLIIFLSICSMEINYSCHYKIYQLFLMSSTLFQISCGFSYKQPMSCNVVNSFEIEEQDWFEKTPNWWLQTDANGRRKIILTISIIQFDAMAPIPFDLILSLLNGIKDVPLFSFIETMHWSFCFYFYHQFLIQNNSIFNWKNSKTFTDLQTFFSANIRKRVLVPLISLQKLESIRSKELGSGGINHLKFKSSISKC